MKIHALGFTFRSTSTRSRKKTQSKTKLKKGVGKPPRVYLILGHHGAYRQAHHDAADREFCGFVLAHWCFLGGFYMSSMSMSTAKDGES